MKIFSMVALLIGGYNWFCIGFLQYDFIAGFFGSQASIFSRLLYIAIGISCFNVSFNLLKNKGKVILTTPKQKILKTKPTNPQANNFAENSEDIKCSNCGKDNN